MAYVVYDKMSTRIVGGSYKMYKTYAAAKAAITRIANKGHAVNDLAVSDYDAYAMFIREKVKRVNLLSGEEYYEDVNTPLCCSPASETYWSM